MKNGTETLVDVYECWETHDLDWTRLMQKKRRKGKEDSNRVNLEI